MSVFWNVGIALTMKAASTPETSVNFYLTLRRETAKESLLGHRHQKLKTHNYVAGPLCIFGLRSR